MKGGMRGVWRGWYEWDMRWVGVLCHGGNIRITLYTHSCGWSSTKLTRFSNNYVMNCQYHQNTICIPYHCSVHIALKYQCPLNVLEVILLHQLVDVMMFPCLGELVVYCDGPGKAAHCQVSAVEEGVYQLDVTSQEAGEHTLHVEYSGQDVTGIY